MGKYRRRATKNKKNKKRAVALTAMAVPVVSLLGFAYATDTHAPGVDLLDTTIFIDGTKDVLPAAQPYDPYRMKRTLQGVYAQDGADVLFDCSAQCTTFQSGDNVFIVYPRSVGLLTGPTDPTYDQSEAIATKEILAAIAQAQANERADADTNDKIYVVGYSQGAGAAAQALDQLQGKDTGNIEQFVLIANPRRNDGGILTRVPDGVYAPGAGVTFGDGTSNPTGITVIQVTKQYDGIADSPKYTLNPLADTNAAMGFYYLHRDFYQNVQLDVTSPNNPGVPDGRVTQEDLALLEQMPDKYVVTHSSDGVTDVLVRTPVGQLPLTRPLLDAGVPPETVAAMDAALRTIIEAGYDRPQPGEPYPSQPVRFEPLPTSPTGWQALAGRSAQLLAGAVQPNQATPVQLAQPTAAQPATTTRQSAAADQPVLTSSTASTSRDTQLAASDDPTDQPSTTQPTSLPGPKKPKPSPPTINTRSETGNVVRSVTGNRGGSSTNGSSTETNASTTTNGTVTSRSGSTKNGTAPSGSPSGASSASKGPSK